MNLRNVFALAASFFAVAAYGETKSSNTTFVFLRPETSSFWTTATGSTLVLPIDFPGKSDSATLEVTGLGYSKVYRNITEDTYELQLPEPVSAQTENVYSLTLTFNDGTVRTAKLGLVTGITAGADGITRCMLFEDGSAWNKIRYRAVIPIPYGMESFTLVSNGGEPVEMDTGLGGAQGWYALGPVARGDDVVLSGTANGDVFEAFLRGWGDGFFFKVR